MGLLQRAGTYGNIHLPGSHLNLDRVVRDVLKLRGCHVVFGCKLFGVDRCRCKFTLNEKANTSPLLGTIRAPQPERMFRVYQMRINSVRSRLRLGILLERPAKRKRPVSEYYPRSWMHRIIKAPRQTRGFFIYSHLAHQSAL